MRTHQSTLTCSSCGRAATLTVTDTRPRTVHDDDVTGYSIVFECDGRCQSPSQAALYELWSVQRG